MPHTLIRQLQKEAISVRHSCRILDVSRSGFYEAQRRSAKPVWCKASAGFDIGRYKVRSLFDAPAGFEAGLEAQVRPYDGQQARPASG